jgi:hypothetical protein
MDSHVDGADDGVRTTYTGPWLAGHLEVRAERKEMLILEGMDFGWMGDGREGRAVRCK